MLAPLVAHDALKALFDGAADLPPVVMNDKRLTGFTPVTGAPGIAAKFVMFTEAPEVLSTAFGENPEWELSCPVTSVFMVEGEATPARDDVWAAGIAALASILFPNGRGVTVDGAFEDLRFEASEHDHILQDAGATPIEALEVTVSVIVTAATPFG